MTDPTPGSANNSIRLGLCLGALGVVYGDIGTSPLYTMRECLHHLHGTARTDGVLGILSLMFWTVMIAVNIKYLLFVTRADNRGEGGIFALLALSHSGKPEKKNPRRIIGFGTGRHVALRRLWQGLAL